MLKLRLQYFGHMMRRADSLEKTLVLGKIEGKRRREWLTMRRLDSITYSMDMNLSKLQETVKDRGVCHGVAESDMTDWLNNNKINEFDGIAMETIQKETPLTHTKRIQNN